MKKKSILIAVALFVLAGAVFGYIYKTNKDFAKEVSVEKVFDTEAKTIEDAKEGIIEGEIKVFGSIDGEKIDVKVISNGVSKEDIKSKVAHIDLKNKVSADISTKEFGQKKLNDLKADIDVKILDNKIYYKASVDLDKLSKVFEGNKEVQSGIQFAGLMANNKTFVLDLDQISQITGQENIISDIYDIEENKKMVSLVKDLYVQDKPFALSYLNETETIEGQKAGKFELIFDFDKTIDFYLNLIQKLDKEQQMSKEEIAGIVSEIKNNKEIFLNNVKGGVYVWVTQDNRVVKTKVEAKVDVVKMGNEFIEKTGEGNKVEGDLKLEINFTGTQKTVSKVGVQKPTDAVDVMSLIGGFMPQTSQTVNFGGETAKTEIQTNKK